MIQVYTISKSYSGKEVLKNVSFEIQAGEVVGFLGPNGAGKTTTMRILTGYTLPNNGKVKFDGQDIQDNAVNIRRHIGYLPENNPLYDSMRVFEYLEFAARMKSVDFEDIKRVVKATHLQDKLTATISELSKGYRQRVGLADALLGDPQVLILDEPTSGLDPNQALEIRKLIRETGKTKTVIFSTHILTEVQAICDRVLIINNGKIVGQGTVEELVQKAQGKTEVRVRIEGSQDKILETFKHYKNIDSIAAVNDEEYIVVSSSSHDICRDIYQVCVKHNWVLLRMTTTEMSLEDVFRQLTK